MAEKKHTHQPLDLDEVMGSSEAFILKYKNKLIGGIAAAVILVGGYLGYRHFIAEPKEAKATEAIFKGEQYFDDGNFELALNGDSVGYKGFIKVAEEFSGTDAGNLANAYAGISLAQLGKDDQLVGPAILGTIGNCYAQLGQLDKAASTLIKAADKADSQALSPIYLIQAGELYEKLNKNSEAVEAYTLIKNKYFESYQSMDIDKYIERASIK